MMASQPRGGHIFNIDGAGSDGRPTPRCVFTSLEYFISLLGAIFWIYFKNVAVYLLMSSVTAKLGMVANTQTPLHSCALQI